MPYIAGLINENKRLYFAVGSESLNMIEVNQSIKNGTRIIKVYY